MPFQLPFNPALKNVPVYQGGRPIEEVARELGLPTDDIIKLASNENPLGPSPAALAAMQKVLASLNLYPDGHALLEPGVDVVMSQYSFLLYFLITRLFNANPVVVPARNYAHDLPAMLAA